MNRPRRPSQFPPRRRPGGPPASPTPSGPPRRRSALDLIPPTVEPRFQVLGTGVDRHALMSRAEPLELVVIHGFSREIDEAFQAYKGRAEDFWKNNPRLLEQARKLDDILAKIQARTSGR